MSIQYITDLDGGTIVVSCPNIESGTTLSEYEKICKKVYLTYRQTLGMTSHEDARELVNDIFVQRGATERELFLQLADMADDELSELDRS